MRPLYRLKDPAIRWPISVFPDGVPAFLPLSDGVTWVVTRNFTIIYPDGRKSEIPKGFLTDFLSVPRIARSFVDIWGVEGPCYVGHDWDYWIELVARSQADADAYAISRLCGTPWLRAQMTYRALQGFGWIGWNGDAKDRKEHGTHSRIRPDLADKLTIRYGMVSI